MCRPYQYWHNDNRKLRLSKQLEPIGQGNINTKLGYGNYEYGKEKQDYKQLDKQLAAEFIKLRNCNLLTLVSPKSDIISKSCSLRISTYELVKI